MPITPGKTMARRKRSEHYVNNKEFLAALIKYREDKEIAQIKGLPKPVKCDIRRTCSSQKIEAKCTYLRAQEELDNKQGI